MHLLNSYLSKLFLVIAVSTWLVACGSDNGEPATDTTPDAFHFDDQSDVAPGTVISSNSITVTGIEAATSISVTDGEYAIDGGAFTSAAGTVSNGQTVRVRHTSSSLYTTMTATFISIGGVSGSFVSTTGPIGTGFNKAGGFNGSVTTISPTTDGSGDLYVIGYFTTYNSTASGHVIRLNSDGTVDTAFTVGAGFDEVVMSISSATDGSGDLYLGGMFTTYNGIASNHIIRLNRDGTVDTAFTVGSGFDDNVYNISPAPDGSGDLYVGGNFDTYNGTASNKIIRLNSDGTVDTAFAVGTGFNSSVNIISSATDGSGDLYVGGNFNVYNGIESNNIIRLNSDGSVDTAFAQGSGFDRSVKSVIPATDGSGDLYVGGGFTTYNDTTGYSQLIRLNSDGTVDTAFEIEWNWTSSYETGVLCFSTATDGSGDLYVGGGFVVRIDYNNPSLSGIVTNNIMRLNSDGTVDATFVVGNGFDDDVYSISPAADGSGDLYVGGEFTAFKPGFLITHPSNNIIRLNSDGTLDSAFVVGTGFETLDPTQPDWVDLYNAVYSISPATDGSGDLYAGGDFNSYNGITSNHIIRLNSDGTVDSAFETGTGFDEPVRSIISTTDGSGDLYVGGEFTTYNGIASNHIIRLNSDGTVDTAFAVGSGFNSTVNTLSLATDGSGDLFVGGSFTSYQSTTVDNIARLNPDGSLN